ncbi:MAG: hypothetical protein SOX30_06050 [Lachnospiraceae bacterium]|nr:hypothetical protein [Lachnospiraceae bacterium]
MRISIIHTREICYYSGEFFLRRMEEALESIGCEVEYLELSHDDVDYDCLEDLLPEKEERSRYDAILDINSKLPYLTLEDGSPFLDRLNAPFYNWIVDHPLYHHPGLSFPLKNYHVLAIDQCHMSYMKANYPWLRSVDYLPIPGTAAFLSEDGERSCDNMTGEKVPGILVPATYLSKEECMEEWKRVIEKIRVKEDTLGESGRLVRSFEDLINDLYQAWDPLQQSLEDLLFDYLGSRGEVAEEYAADSFAELMNFLYPLDRRVRYEMRYRYVRAAAQTGYPIRLLGEGWEETDLVRLANVEHIAPVPISMTYDLIADSEAILDINPLFYKGVHDRVPSAMANGVPVFTNMNQRANLTMNRRNGVFYYHTEDELKDRMKEWQELSEHNPQELIEMRWNAYSRWKADLSWDAAASRFLCLVRDNAWK